MVDAKPLFLSKRKRVLAREFGPRKWPAITGDTASRQATEACYEVAGGVRCDARPTLWLIRFLVMPNLDRFSIVLIRFKGSVSCRFEAVMHQFAGSAATEMFLFEAGNAFTDFSRRRDSIRALQTDFFGNSFDTSLPTRLRSCYWNAGCPPSRYTDAPQFVSGQFSVSSVFFFRLNMYSIVDWLDMYG